EAVMRHDHRRLADPHARSESRDREVLAEARVTVDDAEDDGSERDRMAGEHEPVAGDHDADARGSRRWSDRMRNTCQRQQRDRAAVQTAIAHDRLRLNFLPSVGSAASYPQGNSLDAAVGLAGRA